MGSLVWITGASSGIGKALADSVPWDDARIIDISRSGHPEATPAGLDSRIEHVAADLSTPEGWDMAAASFARKFEQVDGGRAVLIHCAGTLSPMGFAGEVDSVAYRGQVLLNAAAPQVLGDAFIRALGNRDIEAHIVMISSGAASSVYEGWSAYGPAKAAVDHWVRTVGAERDRRHDDVRLVSVAPGVVATAMQAQIREMDVEQFPAVQKFTRLYENDELTSPEEAAAGIWAFFDRELDNGAVVDLRELDD